MTKIDPISAATAFAAVLFGPDLAHVIGPYSVIAIASSTGAGWALGRQEPMGSNLRACFFFVKLNAMALLLTVPLALGIQSVLGVGDYNWMLAPIALLIGGIGNNWPAVGEWLVSRFGRMFERRAGVDDSTKGD